MGVCVMKCLAMLLDLLSLHSLLCVILLTIRIPFVMMAVLRSKSPRKDVTESSGSKGGGSHGEASRTDSIDDSALCGSKFSLVFWACASRVSGRHECFGSQKSGFASRGCWHSTFISGGGVSTLPYEHLLSFGSVGFSSIPNQVRVATRLALLLAPEPQRTSVAMPIGESMVPSA